MDTPTKSRLPAGDLVLKITGTIIAVVVAALALTTALNALRLEQTSTQLLADRLTRIATEVRSVAQRGLDLGLTLSAMDTLPPILEEYAAADPRIVSLAVHDCAGTLIARAPRAAPSTGGATPWADKLGAAEWSLFQPGIASLGLEMRNNLGECAGGVAVTYDSSAQAANLRDAVHTLTTNAVIASLTAVPAVVATMLLLARRRRRLLAVQADLDALEAGGGAASPPAPREAPAPEDDVAAAYWAARPALAAALRDRRPGAAQTAPQAEAAP